MMLRDDNVRNPALFSTSGPKVFFFFPLDLFHAFYDLVSVFSFWLSKKFISVVFFFFAISTSSYLVPRVKLFSFSEHVYYHLLWNSHFDYRMYTSNPFYYYYSLFCILESMDLLMTLRKYKCVHRACMTRYLQDCKALHASLN